MTSSYLNDITKDAAPFQETQHTLLLLEIRCQPSLVYCAAGEATPEWPSRHLSNETHSTGYADLLGRHTSFTHTVKSTAGV